MLDNIFTGLFDSEFTTVIHVTDFLLCLGLALVLGLVMALAYLHRARCTQSFVVTLALLPAVVCIVIMLVNGNVGAGVFRPRHGKRDLRAVSGHGRGAYYRHGLSGFRGAVHRHYVRDVCPV